MAFKIAELYAEVTARGTKFNAAMRGFKSVANATSKAMGAVVDVAQKVLKVGVAAITAVTVIYGRYEQSMARVKAITEATEVEFKQLENTAQRLGRTTVFSAKQAADAMGFLAVTGLKTNEIIAAMPHVLNLAAAGQLDMATSADIVAKIMRGMGLSAEDLGHTVDVLAKAFTSSNTTLPMLGEAMKFVGPVAKTVSKDIEEVTAVIMALSDAGIQGGMAGTTLRRALSALAGGSPAAKKGLKALGVEVADSDGKMLHMAVIIDNLNNSMKNMNEVDRLAKLMEIFGQRAGPGMAELLSVGSEKILKYEKSLEGAGGAAKRIADIQLNTLYGALKLIWNAVEGLSIKLGEILAPSLRFLAQVLTTVTVNLENLVGKFNEGGKAGDGLRNSVESAFKSIVGFVSDAITLVKEWQLVWEIAKLKIIIAIMGIATEAGKIMQKVMEFIAGTVEWMASAVAKTMSYIGESISNSLEWVVNNITKLFTTMYKWVLEKIPENAIASLLKLFFSLQVGALQIIYALIKGIISLFIWMVVEAVKLNWKMITMIVAGFAWLVRTVNEAIVSMVVFVAGVLWNLPKIVVNVATSIVSTFQTLVASVIDYMIHWRKAFSDFFGWLGSLFVKIAIGIANMWDSVTTNLKDTLINWSSNILNFFTKLWAYIKSGGAKGFDFVWKSMGDGLKSVFEGFPDIAGKSMDDIQKILKDRMKKAMDDLKKEQDKMNAAALAGLGLGPKPDQDPVPDAVPNQPTLPPSGSGGGGGGGGGVAASVAKEIAFVGIAEMLKQVQVAAAKTQKEAAKEQREKELLNETKKQTNAIKALPREMEEALLNSLEISAIGP